MSGHDPGLGAALVDFGAALIEAGTIIAVTVWDVLAAHPQLRTALASALVVATCVWLAVWFVDGVHNPRRKCWPCSGRGQFTSRLFPKRDRACRCCGGSGRHATLPARVWRNGNRT